MNVLIIVDHPWNGSFCHSCKDSAINGIKKGGHDYHLIDLNKESFNPVMNEKELALYSTGQFIDPKVEEYQKRIEWAEHIIFIFPIWWEIMPSLLKGFCDKVFLNKWAYEKIGLLPTGKLNFIKSATVITTMGTPGWLYRFKYGNAIKKSLIIGTLRFCGIKRTRWFNFSNIDASNIEQRKRWLSKVTIRLSQLQY